MEYWHQFTTSGANSQIWRAPHFIIFEASTSQHYRAPTILYFPLFLLLKYCFDGGSWSQEHGTVFSFMTTKVQKHQYHKFYVPIHDHKSPFVGGHGRFEGRWASGDKNQYNLFCRHRRFEYFLSNNFFEKNNISKTSISQIFCICSWPRKSKNINITNFMWGKTSTFGQVKQFAKFECQLKIYESLYFGRTCFIIDLHVDKDWKISFSFCHNLNSVSAVILKIVYLYLVEKINSLKLQAMGITNGLSLVNITSLWCSFWHSVNVFVCRYFKILNLKKLIKLKIFFNSRKVFLKRPLDGQ